MATTKADQVRDYWENPTTISLRDESLRQLETEAIARFLEPSHSVLDVGCGDGVNTLVYAERAARVLGVDRSHQMIGRARGRLAERSLSNVRFEQLSVEEIDRLDERFDVVLTQRCLINLNSFEEQKAVIATIEKLIRPGGRYLMLESVDEGRDRLNELRARVGLPAVPMPWHNCFFHARELMPLLEKTFHVEEVHDFTLYWLITRLLVPLMSLDPQNPLAKQIDTAAQRLQSSIELDGMDGVGTQRLFVLRKA
jgi:ubiquinone/menaquinone biosynthesis C-methylase UbiE